MLGQLTRPHQVVVADFEAGLGTIMRLSGNPVDIVVVVCEPTAKSLDVGSRAAESVRAAELGRVVVSANRVRNATDEARVHAAFPGFELMLVPDDPAIVAAERAGAAPLDAAPTAPAVRALVALAERLLDGRIPAARTGQ